MLEHEVYMKYKCKTAKELLKKIKNEEIKMVDLRFTDMPGSVSYTHLTLPTILRV